MIARVIEVTWLMAVGASIAVEIIIVMTFLGYPS